MSTSARSSSRPSSRRHSRRPTGTLSFSHLSVSPLTSASITEDNFQSPPGHQRSASYIQGASAPATPGILSRTHSYGLARSRPRSRGSSVDLGRSKSATQLAAAARDNGGSEWLHRTGALLTEDARESKGQGWLSARASSTSLVRLDVEGERSFAVDVCEPLWGHEGEERGGGKEGEEGQGELGEGELGYRGLRGEAGGVGYAPEAEDERSFTGGFGLGMFIDRWVGWSLFADDSESEDELEVERPPRSGDRRLKMTPSEAVERQKKQREWRDESVEWQDPSWVLGIASSILL